MRNTFTWLTSMALWPLPALAQPRITITLFDRAGLHAGIRETMETEASRIFREAGIQMEWLDCATVGQPSADCLLPLGPTRLRLELLPGSNKKSPTLIGMAFVKPHGPNVVAAVYPDRVQKLAMDASWEFGELLGHAAAHEIGHLLLGSTGHSPAGIMRASWEVKDLWHLPHSGLIFLPRQLSSIRTAMVRQISESGPDGTAEKQ